MTCPPRRVGDMTVDELRELVREVLREERAAKRTPAPKPIPKAASAAMLERIAGVHRRKGIVPGRGGRG